MRAIRTLAIGVLLHALAGCGSDDAAGPDDDNTNNNNNNTTSGRVEEAESILKEVLAVYDPTQPKGVAGSISGIYASLGDGDNAVSWMNKGIEEGYAARMHIVFPQYDSIRGHPGFARIVESIGVAAFWAHPTLGK